MQRQRSRGGRSRQMTASLTTAHALSRWSSCASGTLSSSIARRESLARLEISLMKILNALRSLTRPQAAPIRTKPPRVTPTVWRNMSPRWSPWAPSSRSSTLNRVTLRRLKTQTP